MKAIQVQVPGGPESLQLVDLPDPLPGPGQVRVKARAIGVGRPDVLIRKGTYKWMPPLPAIPGANLRFVQGDVRPVHAAIRAAAGDDKNLWIVGGGDLAGQFFDAGLLDELIVQMGSVTLGKGKPLFPRRLTSPPLTLVSVRQMGTGFAELRYQVPAKSAPTPHTSPSGAT